MGKLTSVAGGGDTVAALNQAGAAQDFSYISTAGGAFLEWMEGKNWTARELYTTWLKVLSPEYLRGEMPKGTVVRNIEKTVAKGRGKGGKANAKVKPAPKVKGGKGNNGKGAGA